MELSQSPEGSFAVRTAANFWPWVSRGCGVRFGKVCAENLQMQDFLQFNFNRFFRCCQAKFFLDIQGFAGLRFDFS